MPVGDIREVAATDIPKFDVLTAGFPCQPFSIAGVSKKISMGKKHGFEDEKQGNLFFEITRIVDQHQPELLFLENVKNLVSHDRGRTFQTIRSELENLGYAVTYRIYDAANFVPQHRERIIIVGTRSATVRMPTPSPVQHAIQSILERRVDSKYVLSDKLWNGLQRHALNHKQKGNGFGFGMANLGSVSRTLSARYYKDGSEILIPRPSGNPRRLTPRECARLMGFPDSFQIPVSDTQAYRQFGNSVCVPLMTWLAKDITQQVFENEPSRAKTKIFSDQFSHEVALAA